MLFLPTPTDPQLAQLLGPNFAPSNVDHESLEILLLRKWLDEPRQQQSETDFLAQPLDIIVVPDEVESCCLFGCFLSLPMELERMILLHLLNQETTFAQVRRAFLNYVNTCTLLRQRHQNWLTMLSSLPSVSLVCTSNVIIRFPLETKAEILPLSSGRQFDDFSNIASHSFGLSQTTNLIEEFALHKNRLLLLNTYNPQTLQRTTRNKQIATMPKTTSTLAARWQQHVILNVSKQHIILFDTDSLYQSKIYNKHGGTYHMEMLCVLAPPSFRECTILCTCADLVDKRIFVFAQHQTLKATFVLGYFFPVFAGESVLLSFRQIPFETPNSTYECINAMTLSSQNQHLVLYNNENCFSPSTKRPNTLSMKEHTVQINLQTLQVTNHKFTLRVKADSAQEGGLVNDKNSKCLLVFSDPLPISAQFCRVFRLPKHLCRNSVVGFYQKSNEMSLPFSAEEIGSIHSTIGKYDCSLRRMLPKQISQEFCSSLVAFHSQNADAFTNTNTGKLCQQLYLPLPDAPESFVLVSLHFDPSTGQFQAHFPKVQNFYFVVQYNQTPQNPTGTKISQGNLNAQTQHLCFLWNLDSYTTPHLQTKIMIVHLTDDMKSRLQTRTKSASEQPPKTVSTVELTTLFSTHTLYCKQQNTNNSNNRKRAPRETTTTAKTIKKNNSNKNA